MDPIHLTLERFHANLRGELEGGLDALLHPDVVFLSPVVFTPQVGIDVTKLYLGAAGGTLGGEAKGGESKGTDDGKFKYIKTIASGHHAMLEFETTVDGKYVNGVDILTCDDDSMVTEFKVMIRPLQAINMVHEQMRAMLERMQSQS